MNVSAASVELNSNSINGGMKELRLQVRVDLGDRYVAVTEQLLDFVERDPFLYQPTREGVAKTVEMQLVIR